MSEAEDRKDPDGALLRLAVIGPLLAAPPAKGGLQAALQELAGKDWTDRDGKVRRFAVSTIESWYYKAKNSHDTMAPLRRQKRSDAGRHPSVSAPIMAAVQEQYRNWPWFSVELHHKNLAASVAADPALGRLPSYATLRRVMHDRGMKRVPREKIGKTITVSERLLYEVEQTNSFVACRFPPRPMPDRGPGWHHPPATALRRD